jgi:hypothetical protein
LISNINSVVSALGSFTISSSNNLTTFTSSSNAVTITTNPVQTVNGLPVRPLPTLATFLGYSNGATGTTITSTGSVNINYDTYINVWLQNLATSSQETTRCTFKIPLVTGPGTTIQWADNVQNEAKVEVTDSSVIVDRLIITVTDRYGQIVDNNGLDWSFTMEIEADT